MLWEGFIPSIPALLRWVCCYVQGHSGWPKLDALSWVILWAMQPNKLKLGIVGLCKLEGTHLHQWCGSSTKIKWRKGKGWKSQIKRREDSSGGRKVTEHPSPFLEGNKSRYIDFAFCAPILSLLSSFPANSLERITLLCIKRCYQPKSKHGLTLTNTSSKQKYLTALEMLP